jgi:hypothetical protein
MILEEIARSVPTRRVADISDIGRASEFEDPIVLPNGRALRNRDDVRGLDHGPPFCDAGMGGD